MLFPLTVLVSPTTVLAEFSGGGGHPGSMSLWSSAAPEDSSTPTSAGLLPRLRRFKTRGRSCAILKSSPQTSNLRLPPALAEDPIGVGGPQAPATQRKSIGMAVIFWPVLLRPFSGRGVDDERGCSLCSGDVPTSAECFCEGERPSRHL